MPRKIHPVWCLTCAIAALAGVAAYQQWRIAQLERKLAAGSAFADDAIGTTNPAAADSKTKSGKGESGDLGASARALREELANARQALQALQQWKKQSANPGTGSTASATSPLSIRGSYTGAGVITGTDLDLLVDPLERGTLRSSPRTMEEAQEIVRSQPVVAGKGPRWSDAQATGHPDTEGSGDLETAWAPRSTRSGLQWLQLGYGKAVEIGSVNVLETYNPGALAKVAAIMPDGTERTLWEGTAPAGEPPVETSIPVPKGVTSDKIKLYVDTNRVTSWPEIDAVELVGVDGSRQWANSSSTSGHFGDAQSYLPR